MSKTTRKRLVIVFSISLLLGGSWMFNTVVAQSNRSCVCHVENKNTGAGHVLEVDEDSLKGHLKHGDIQCTVNCDDVINNKCNVSTGGQCSQ